MLDAAVFLNKKTIPKIVDPLLPGCKIEIGVVVVGKLSAPSARYEYSYVKDNASFPDPKCQCNSSHAYRNFSNTCMCILKLKTNLI